MHPGCRKKGNPMTPFVLNLPDVIAKNRIALERRLLGAQNGNRECMYRYPKGMGCAIGVCLPEAIIARILDASVNRSGISNLAYWKILDYKEHEFQRLSLIQSLHDNWIVSRTVADAYYINDVCDLPESIRDWLVKNQERVVDEVVFREALDVIEATL